MKYDCEKNKKWEYYYVRELGKERDKAKIGWYAGWK